VTPPPPALAAFESTAPFYDELTDYSDYDLAMGLIEGLAERYGLAGKRLLDVACGTGNSFMPLLRRGYSVTGCDLSPAMVERARAKADGRARVFVADMRELGRLGPHDLVTCIDEPLNYLLSDEDVGRFFASVAVNLAPAGLLLFDVNTVRTYRSAFAESARYQAGGWSFLWKGEADPGFRAGQTAGLTIEATTQTARGRRRRASSRHLQRHWSRRTLKRLMSSAGLECVAVHGMTHQGELRQPAREDRHSRFIYVARLARD
jgi:predicted TPR repeat methyltransferase